MLPVHYTHTSFPLFRYDMYVRDAPSQPLMHEVMSTSADLDSRKSHSERALQHLGDLAVYPVPRLRFHLPMFIRSVDLNRSVRVKKQE